MTVYYVYLTDRSTVEASLIKDREGVLIGSFEGSTQDLTTILEFAQGAADATIAQLLGKIKVDTWGSN
jgi:hypothetical protein